MEWQLENPLTGAREIWRQEALRFSPRSVDGRTVDPAACNLDLLSPKRCRNAACGTETLLPNGFGFCPSCGGALAPSLVPNLASWSPPHGNFDGNRSLPRLSWREIASPPQPLSLPEGGGNFSFLASDDPCLLLAFDRAHHKTRIFGHSQLLSSWVLHGAIPAFKGPPWSWSAAAGLGGFAAPTDQGPVWVSYSSDGGEFATQLADPAAGLGATGGAAITRAAGGRGDAVACVPCRAKGGLVVAHCRCGRDAGWGLAPVDAPSGLAGAPFFLSAPACDGLGNMYWAGENGFLSVHIDGDVIHPVWRAWEPPHLGQPQFMPYRDRSSVLWQVTFDGGGYFYNRLGQEGVLDRIPVSGPHQPVGTRSFYLDELYEEPWQEESYDFYPERSFFVQPLLELANGVLYLGTPDLRSIQSYTDPKSNERLVGELGLRLTSGGAEVLRASVPFTSPWDAEVFLSRGGLYLYLHSRNLCWFWPDAYDRS